MGPRHWVPVLGLAQIRVWPKVSAAQRLLPPIRYWPPRQTFRTIGTLFHARFYNEDIHLILLHIPCPHLLISYLCKTSSAASLRIGPAPGLPPKVVGTWEIPVSGPYSLGLCLVPLAQ
mgnify:CR=1 FL=1